MANRPRSRTEEELVLPLDVDRARAETPGCRSVVHLNNAGASLPPQPVLDAVIDHLRLEASIGGYEAAADQGPAIEHAYDAVATLLGARREEIALVENATRAWDMAFYALPLEPGDRILTATSEYASNVIAFLQLARRRGVRVEVVPDDPSGQLDVEALRGLLDERVKLIAINHVPTHNGMVTFSVAGHEAGEVAAALARQRINVSQSRPEAARYDFEARGLPALVRASAHYYNTEDELEALARAVEAL